MDLVVRAGFIYLVVLVFTRIIGRRELSQLQPFDLIVLVLIGDIIQKGVTQSDDSVTGRAAGPLDHRGPAGRHVLPELPVRQAPALSQWRADLCWWRTASSSTRTCGANA